MATPHEAPRPATAAPPPEASEAPEGHDAATVARIEQLLHTRDDTTRFVGLALLKALLDNQDQLAAPLRARLWDALPVRFLDRLLRSKAASSPASAAQRSLAVAVLHTFAVRLPPADDADDRLAGRVPLLVAALPLLSAEESESTESSQSAESSHTTNPSSSPSTPPLALALQTLTTLVGRRQGARAFNALPPDCLQPLIVLAPAQPLALQVLLRAWLYGLWERSMSTSTSDDDDNDDLPDVPDHIQHTLPTLVTAFAGTDGVTLLDFVARLLRTAAALAETSVCPGRDSDFFLLPQPTADWLHPVVGFLRRLATARPNAAARTASTHAAAALLRVYPATVPALLFAASPIDGSSADTSSTDTNPFAFLFLSLLLIDLRTTLPGLLALLNSPAYGPTAARLAAALDVLSAFVGFLLHSLDDDSQPAVLPPDHLLRLRTAIAETLSAVAEYLRDRWDAAVAGAPGLHPDARTGSAADSVGPPLPWDAVAANSIVSHDPLVLAALRALSLWLREEDDDAFRREAAGLADMLVDLYAGSTHAAAAAAADPDYLDFRLPVLVAIEGMASLRNGADGAAYDDDDDLADDPVQALLRHNVWAVLSADLVAILQQPAVSDADAYRGSEIATALLLIAETEQPGARAEWMDLVTHVAAWSGPEDAAVDPSNDFLYYSIFHLVTVLIESAHPVMRRRYTLSVAAIISLLRRLRPTFAKSPLAAEFDTDMATLESSR